MESAQGAPPDDEHDPDGATVGFERAQAAALVDMARARLVELDGALARIDAGTYGVCESCGRQIGAARLAAVPGAHTCVSCATPKRFRARRR